MAAYEKINKEYEAKLPSAPIKGVGPATEAAKNMINSLDSALKKTEAKDDQHMPRSEWAPIEAQEKE